MPGRGGSTARAARVPAAREDSGRTVSEEITVIVNTLRERRDADRVIATRMKGADRGRQVETQARKRKSTMPTLEGPGHPGASQASIDELLSKN
jgi:hypothetical protein